MSTGKIKLALALSGASTGGAFEAGVIDFLLEALQQWQLAHGQDPEKYPEPNVELSDLVGTSAGGITSTLTVASLNNNFQPLPNDFKMGSPAPKNNPLFETWVTRMDYSGLFRLDDFGLNAEIRSILNANFMGDSARAVLRNDTKLSLLPPYCKDVEVSLTSTNLTGTPYAIQFDNDEQFYMQDHEDYTTFGLRDENATSDEKGFNGDNYPLNPMDTNRTGGNWPRLLLSAQATAAYPRGFPAINLEKDKEAYNSRNALDPTWPSGTGNTIYYSSIDGGWANEDPFGIVMKQMGIKEDPQQEFANFVIMVDPFPSVESTETSYNTKPTKDMNIFDAVAHTEMATGSQSVLKKGFLTGEYDKFRKLTKIFALTPKGPSHQYGTDTSIRCATATLAHFGGMMDEEIRLHDYMLGRQNCQEFLSKSLTLEKLALSKEGDSSPASGAKPVIPLCGTAAKTCPKPDWPNFSFGKRLSIACSVAAHAALRFCALFSLLPNTRGWGFSWFFVPLLFFIGIFTVIPMVFIGMAFLVMGVLGVFTGKTVTKPTNYGTGTIQGSVA